MTRFPALDAFFDRILPFRQSTDRKILFFGLDCAGKTTFLYRLALGEVVTTIPTIGFNVESVNIPLAAGKKIQVTGWDVGGCDKIRPLWKHYFQYTDGALFMVDSSDRERIAEAVEEGFYMMKQLTEDKDGLGLRPVPWLVLANKQDLPNAMSPLEIHTRFLKALPAGMNSRLLGVYPLSAIAPKSDFMQHIVPAFTWFDNAIRDHEANILNHAATSSQPSPSQSEVTLTPAPPPKVNKPDFDPRSPDVLAEKLESWVARASTDSPPEEFLEQFNKVNLPAWDHYTHIRIAYVILTVFGRQKGKNMIFDGIQNYITNSTQTTGRAFHITMTYFWIQIVHYGIASMPAASFLPVAPDKDTTPADRFSLFLVMNPHVCDGMLFSDYYNKQTIMSPAAKEAMVLPDIKPLPNVVQREAPPKGKAAT